MCFGHSFLAAVNAIHRPCLVIREIAIIGVPEPEGRPLIRVLEQPLASPVSAEGWVPSLRNIAKTSTLYAPRQLNHSGIPLRSITWARSCSPWDEIY